VPADLTLVVHAPERKARVLAPRRPRDALAERGLADARRADEAQDGALPVRVELLDRQELQDALLDGLQTLVILVQHSLRARQVDLLGRARVPWQLHERLQPPAQHRVFRGVLGGAPQAPVLALRASSSASFGAFTDSMLRASWMMSSVSSCSSSSPSSRWI
jgi:hypothetical protein